MLESEFYILFDDIQFGIHDGLVRFLMGILSTWLPTTYIESNWV